MKSITFDAIGTQWSIDMYDSLSEHAITSVVTEVRQRIASFEETYSRFAQSSLITTMSRTPGRYLLPDNGMEMLRLYEQLYILSDGLFTPLIGSMLEEAGYDASYSLQPKTLHEIPRWEDVLMLDENILELTKPALLDVGALGKGALIDRVSDVMLAHELKQYCIDAGGDILYKTENDKKLTVGLEHPSDPKQVIGVTSITNQSIAGSAGNRRRWGDFHHILNPNTLKPAEGILASWIIAESAMLADALATAVFFISPEKLSEQFRFEYLLILPDMSIRKSDAFPGELYYT